jgi:beta-lactamase regulating signal transducer with metallopeptidase domain
MQSTLTLNAWSEHWFGLISATVVQSTLLAAMIAALAWLLRNASPAVRYWLWQIVAIRLLMVPFWTVSLSVPWLAADVPLPLAVAPTSDLADHSVLAAETKLNSRVDQRVPEATESRRAIQAKSTSSALTWRSWLLLVWLVIVGSQCARLLMQRRRLSRLLASTSPASDAMVAACRGIAARLAISRAPDVRLSNCAGSTFVCGIWRPTLVVSRTLAATLTPAELAPVLAHELAHVKRRDLLWGWTAELVRILYFFHPVAYWAGYQIRLEREMACDQLALAHGGSGAADYAATLVRVLSATSEPSIFRTTMAAGLDGGDVGEF